MLTPFIRVAPLHAVQHHWSVGQDVSGPVGGACVFWLVTQGCVEVEAARGRWILEEGSAFLFSLTGERRVFTPRGAQWLSIGLRATAYDSLELANLLPLPAQWNPGSDFDALRACAEGIAQNWGAPRFAAVDARTFSLYMQQQRRHPLEADTSRALLCSGFAQALFALCWQKLSERSLESAIGHRFPDWMPKILHCARENPAAGIEELARNVGISRRHLAREFGRCFGVAPREFFMRRRLEEARRMLTNSQLSLPVIAQQTGFANAAHFSRAFKAAFAMSPDNFRRTAGREDAVI